MNVKGFLVVVVAFFSLLSMPQHSAAQFSKGTVIQLVNKNTGKAAAANASRVSCVDRNSADYSQLWYVESRSYNAIPIGYKVRLRNLSNGHYLQGNNNSSVLWSTVKNTGTYTEWYDGKDTQFTTELWEAERDGYYTLGVDNKKTGDTDYYYDKLHCDASGTCVSWMGSADASLWSIEVVSGVDVQAQWNKFAEFENMANRKDEFQGYLNTLFTDNLCTELRSAYKSQSALVASSAYQALPQELKNMALKVCNGNWAETNRDNSNVSWTSTAAKRFRVQTIEPYSVAEEISNVVKVGAYSNMNNPTGIYAGDMNMIYVMVKGNINQGSALYIAGLGHNSKDYLTSIKGSDPVQLSTGLNIIPFYGDKNMLYLIYGVNSQSSSYPLANYPDIEVHIEGGCINGLYDRSMNDAAIYGELSSNASKVGLEYYDVLGDKFVFHTSWETVFRNNSASSINRALDIWDMIGSTQHMVMGVSSAAETANDPLGLHTYTSDFSSVFNNRQLVHTIPTLSAYTQAPHRIQFAHGEGLLQGEVMEKQGYIWGPAHEQGHANQNVINMVGTTEISNNLFSNVAVFYQDYLLSRGGSVADNCEGYKSGTAWHFRDSNSRMRMFYQLWLYYHAAGKNKNFYPKLFEYLRNDPMSIYPSSNGDVYTSNESLKFYKYACLAAGEDLTPFFEAWGFFVPFDKSTITDYSTYSIINNENDINNARSTVAAYGYNKNYAVLFIEDRIGDVFSRKYTGHKKQWIDKAPEKLGTIGMYSDFAGDKSINGDYVWIETEHNTVEISGGTGAAGVIIEQSGSLHSFFNTLELDLDDTVLGGIKSGAYKIKVVGVDGLLYDVKSVDESDSDAAKRAALKLMIDNADEIVRFIDYDGCRVGYYNPIYTAGIELLLVKARDVYNKSLSEEYDIFIDKLVAEMNVLKELGDAAVINVIDGDAYQFENKLHSGNRMYLAANNEVDGAANPPTGTDRWILEYSGNGAGYYIKNKKNGLYIDEMTSYSQQVYADEKSRSTADVYTLNLTADRTVSLAGKSYLLHLDAWMNVVGWFSDADASYWYARRVDVSELETAMFRLDKMIARVKWLVDEMGVNVSFSGNVTVGGVEERYTGIITVPQLVSAAMAVQTAVASKNASDVSVSQINSVYGTLEQHYDILKKAYDAANNVELREAYRHLQGCVNELKSYISGGALAGRLPLQCDDAGGNYYISSNAEQNAGGGIVDGGGVSALIDGLPSTYFHSRWSGAPVDSPHYLQIDMGAGNAVSDFYFNYSLRENNYHTVPTEIMVSGSNDGVNFDEITVIGRDELLGMEIADNVVYELNSNFATATKNARQLSAIKLLSPGCGEQTVQITDKNRIYNDMTSSTLDVIAGETLTLSFVKDGDWSWLHGYVYIDYENDGFTASVTGSRPNEDLVSYSFYGGENNENVGFNSRGASLSGDGRNVLDVPSFTAPEKPGYYRMRVKADWNSIDPKGDNNSNFGGTIKDVNGSIIDVMLHVSDGADTSLNPSFISDTIVCGRNYRYLRFTVTESACFVNSHTCTAEQMKYNGEYFFSMSEFGITKIDCIEPEGTWFPLYVNDAMALVNNAERMLEQSVSVAQFNTCIKEVQQMIELLRRALNTPLPVELTPDVNSPVFYRIVSVLGNSPLEYEIDATTNMYDSAAPPLNLVSFADNDDNELGQAWYFMRGTDVGHYYICPKQGDEKVLGTNPAWPQVMQTGESRVWCVDRSAQGYVTEWKIELLDGGEFVFVPVYATSLVLGRPDEAARRLGFVDDASADGARFAVERCELGATAIDDVAVDVDYGKRGIYDLFGRRVDRVAAPGLYIVDGKKMYIKP